MKAINDTINEQRSAPEYPYYEKIRVLKKKLADSDYIALKFAEGEISAADYAPIKAQRKAWRDEINAAETAIKMIKG